MPATDRVFRALWRAEPKVALALVEVLAPDVVPRGAEIHSEALDDPHLEPPPAPIEADLVARVEPGEVLHVEAQGYNDPSFPSRLFRYHLSLVLRYPTRRVRTVALWMVRPPDDQRRELIEHGDVAVRVTSIALCDASAERLLERVETACFAPAARAATMSSLELCQRVVQVLIESKASGWQLRVAGVAASVGKRYKEMVKAMEDAGMEPINFDEFVRIGEDLGREEGLEEGLERGREEGLERGREELRGSLLDVLEARGIPVGDAERARIAAETSLERLRAWVRRALTASSAAEVVGDEAR